MGHIRLEAQLWEPDSKGPEDLVTAWSRAIGVQGRIMDPNKGPNMEL